MSQKPFSEEELGELRDAFAFFDKDGDGEVTREEMAAIIRGFGQDLDPGVLGPLFAGVDANGDGRLQWDEFVDLVQSLDLSDPTHRAVHQSLVIFLEIRGT